MLSANFKPKRTAAASRGFLATVLFDLASGPGYAPAGVLQTAQHLRLKFTYFLSVSVLDIDGRPYHQSWRLLLFGARFRVPVKKILRKISIHAFV